MIARRPLLVAAGLAATARAGAQPAAPALLLPAPLPCATGPNEEVALVLEGSGAPAGTVVVFGQAFRPVAIPGSRLAARTADGRPLPVQLDVINRHPEGSTRLGVVAITAPALRAGERLGVVLSRADGAAPAALDVGAALAGRQAVLEMGAGPWRLDLLAAFRGAFAAGRPWQSGPLAVQARIAQAVPAAAVGGVTSLRVVADVSLRADGTLWVDAWLRNDVAMRSGGGAVTYDMRLLLDGQPALRAAGVRQHHYTGWGRLVGALRGGAPAPAPPWMRGDILYLADADAIARYDLSLGADPALLPPRAAAMASAEWAAPLNPRGITQYMPMSGGRADIGPATLSNTAWLVTGDPTAGRYALGQAEAAGAIPWHFWDERGGSNGDGGWLDTRRWPQLWTDGRGGAPPNGLLQHVAGDTGWTPDTAHQPDSCFVPFLLTARRAFLDELQAQASFNVMSAWPPPRLQAMPPGHEPGVNLVHEAQVRSAAWSLRQIDNAAWCSPEGDPNLAWVRAVGAANWAWIRSKLPAWTAMQGEAHGWVVGEVNDFTQHVPWQQDYFATTAAAAARRGNADAREVLAWMGNFLAGRFLNGAKGFNPRDGVAYLIARAPAQTAPPYRTWAEIGAATRARDLSNGDGWSKSNGDFAAWALAALAGLVDVIGSPEARQAYAWLAGSGARLTDIAQFQREPTLSIVPRGVVRVPLRAPRCVAGR